MFGFIKVVEKMESRHIQDVLITTVIVVAIATVACFGLVAIQSCNSDEAKLKAFNSAKEERLKVAEIQGREKVLVACKASCGEEGMREAPADGSCVCD